jgi:hypothetical protein
MMADAKADLLARIRKCLALGKSSNENEAAAAIGKARELMDAHGITDEDIALSEISMESVKGNCAQRAPLWEVALCQTVRHALGVTVIIGCDGERNYFGPGAAPMVATYAFSVLFRKLKAQRAEYSRTRLKRCSLARKRQRADVFCEAWATAVYSQVKKLMPRQPVDTRVEQYIERCFGDELTTTTHRAASTKGRDVSSDYWAGHDRGREVELHSAVGSSVGGGKALPHADRA